MLTEKYEKLWQTADIFFQIRYSLQFVFKGSHLNNDKNPIASVIQK